MSENKSILKTVYLDPVWVRKSYETLRPGEFPLEMKSDSVLFLNIKDNETGETEIKMIERPKIDFYSLKDGHESDFPRVAVPKDIVDKHSVEYSKREKELANIIGVGEEYKSRKRQYNSENSENFRDWVSKTIYNNPNLYQADMDIEDYYKTVFIEKYGNNMPKLNRAFADIETFVHDYPGANQNNPLAPINLISYYDERKNTMYGFILNNFGDRIPELNDVHRNPQDFIEKDVERMYDETFDEMYTYFEKTKAKQGYKRPENRPKINTELKFYDSEEILIIDFFNVLNRNKPDVCAWWNMNYDIKYIIGRCKILGIDYNNLFCNEEIPEQYRRVRYVEDRDRYKTESDKKKPFQQMWDYMINPGYTEYIDMMALYANLRKRYQEKSYKLDYISEKIIGTKKVNLYEYGCNVVTAPLRQFRIFLKYSLKDTFLLYLLDNELSDLSTLFFMSSNTRVEQYVKISIVIKNLIFKYLRENDMVIGNNVKYDEWENLDGALVADPRLIAVEPDNRGLFSSMVFSHVVDFDASSEYPNIMLVFNIGKDASFGRVLSVVDRNNNDKILMSGSDFAHALQASETSIIDLGKDLFGLPDITDFMKEIEEAADRR